MILIAERTVTEDDVCEERPDNRYISRTGVQPDLRDVNTVDIYRALIRFKNPKQGECGT